MFENLFKFPIVMVDAENEEKKQELNRLTGASDDGEVDIIIGEAECPYTDFLSVADRWIPTDESLQKALSGKFDACYVQFRECGGYVVPWTKSKFKREYEKFVTELDPEEPMVKHAVMKIDNPEQLVEFLKAGMNGKEDEKE